MFYSHQCQLLSRKEPYWISDDFPQNSFSFVPGSNILPSLSPSLLGQLLCSPDLSSVVCCLFYLLKENKFLSFCPISDQIESFVFTCALSASKNFFSILSPVETPRVQWSAARLWLKVENSLLFLPSIVQHPAGCCLWLHCRAALLGTGALLLPLVLPALYKPHHCWRSQIP